jgi:hypothetical protein
LLQSARHTAQPFVYGAIIMEAMREAWTDERLDDLRDQVDRRFDQVDIRFDKVDAKFDKVDARFDKFEDKVEAGFERIDDRFERFEARMTSRFEWLLRFLLASYVTALIGYFAAHA